MHSIDLPSPSNRPEEPQLRRFSTTSKDLAKSLLINGAILATFGVSFSPSATQDSQPDLNSPTTTASPPPSPKTDSGPSVEEILEELDKKETKTLEQVAKLDAEIESYVDELIETYIEQADQNLIPPIDVYVQLDSFLQAKTVLTNIGLDNISAQTHAYVNKVMTTHEQKVANIISNPDVQWSCDPMQDFTTYQEVVFVGTENGDDPYFDTYSTGSWAASQQIMSGVVNCQVSRMTPIIMQEIYEEHCPASLSLMDGYRTILWEDHIQSGYQTPDQTYTFNEGNLTNPYITGTQPRYAEGPGVAFPVVTHLAVYIIERGVANGKQIARIQASGLTSGSLSRFLHYPMPQITVPFAHEVAPDANYDGFFEESPVSLETDRPLSTKTQDLESSLYLNLSTDARQSHLSAGISAVQLPPWIYDRRFIELILKKDIHDYWTLQDIIPFLNKFAPPEIQREIIKPIINEQLEQNTQKAISDLLGGHVPNEGKYMIELLFEREDFKETWISIDLDSVADSYNENGYIQIIAINYYLLSEYLVRKTGDLSFLKNTKHSRKGTLIAMAPANIHSAPQEDIDKMYALYLNDAKSFRVHTQEEFAPQWKAFFSRLNNEQARTLMITALSSKSLPSHRYCFVYDITNDLIAQNPEDSETYNKLIADRFIKEFYSESHPGTLLGCLAAWEAQAPLLAPAFTTIKETFFQFDTKLTNFEKAYYLQDPTSVRLETIEDFRKLMHVPQDKYFSNYFSVKNLPLNKKITNLYLRTIAPEERMEILTILPGISSRPFIPPFKIYPEDLETIRNLSLNDPSEEDEFSHINVALRAHYAPETLNLETLTDNNDLITITTFIWYHNPELGYHLMKEFLGWKEAENSEI
jgi:hypothetical protein